MKKLAKKIKRNDLAIVMLYESENKSAGNGCTNTSACTSAGTNCTNKQTC